MAISTPKAKFIHIENTIKHHHFVKYFLGFFPLCRVHDVANSMPTGPPEKGLSILTNTQHTYLS